MEKVRPFVKWAGGKGSLIEQLTKYYPLDIKDGAIDTYIEPFVGGGAVLLDILQNYNIKKAYAFDINKDLINCYNVIKTNPKELIDRLKKKENEFLQLSMEDRQSYFYVIRNRYNEEKSSDDIERACQFIFLNRTCFNGLYRVNSQGKFNVPCGKYKNPTICDETNIMNLSRLIKNVEFIYGQYTESEKYITENTFIYFDPPYRPIKKTSGFTSYTKDQFDDNDQIKLSKFYRKLSDKGICVMLSNSDPKNINPDDNFFDNIYAGFNINTINAKRMINADSKGRGAISELVITNYENMESDECIKENSFMKIAVSN